MRGPTPGPWLLDEASVSNAITVFADIPGERENPAICELIEEEHGGREEIEANARAIAGLPVLLAAARHAADEIAAQVGQVTRYETRVYWRQVEGRLREAITNATGEPS